MTTKTKAKTSQPVSVRKKGAQPDRKTSGTSTTGKSEKPARRATSPVGIMREVLAGNPKATIAEIAAVLTQRGVPKSLGTISTIRSDFNGVYRALARAGALKTPVELE